MNETSQLPTPPSESDRENAFDLRPKRGVKSSRFATNPTDSRGTWDINSFPSWDASSSKSQSSATSSPPPLDDAELPTFQQSQQDEVLEANLDPLQLSTQQFDFPDPSSNRDSPSSMQAEFDRDQDHDEDLEQLYETSGTGTELQTIKLDEAAPVSDLDGHAAPAPAHGDDDMDL